jgi:hypothetical protein
MSLQNVNVFVSSTQRQKGTNDSFTIFLNPALSLSRPNTAWEVRLVSTMIPFSFNQINPSNNTLFGFLNSVLWSVVIPPGNYNIIQLTTTLKDLIQTALGVSLTWTYSRATGKTNLSYTAGSGLLELSYASSRVIMEMLGYTADIALNPGQNKTSDQGVNVNPVQSLFIRSSTLNQPSGAKEYLLKPGENSDVLAKVPVLVAPGGFVNWDNASSYGVRLTNRTIDAIELYLSDNLNYTLQLNGQPWVCMLNFEEVQLPLDLEPIPTLQNVARASTNPEEQDKAQRLKELKDQRAQLLKDLETEKKQILDSIKDDVDAQRPRDATAA